MGMADGFFVLFSLDKGLETLRVGGIELQLARFPALMATLGSGLSKACYGPTAACFGER